MIPTIAEASRLLASRQLSPVELTRRCLDRIARYDGALHSFLCLTEDRAMADAKAAEARLVRGERRGPLDGIPIGHKDIYGTAGIATTAHSKLLQGWVPEHDATTVRKLAEAGTVMLGKLATHEFAFGGPSFDLPWPPARNPWNPDHFTSGSSSGTGAAVAAGLILGGTGSDTGGSIRGPAALCGVVGIKPTYGLCSRAGILPLAFSLDHAGPLAWTTEDCALLLQAMAGYDPLDPASADRPVPDYAATIEAGVKGLRIGVARRWHEQERPVSDAVRQGIERTEAIWRAAGAEVRDVVLPPLVDFQAANFIILVSEAFSLHEPWMRERFGDYGLRLRSRMAFGALFAATDYVQAQRTRRELIAATTAACRDLDLVLTAGAGEEAPRIDDVPLWDGLTRPSFTAPMNQTGWPAIGVPSGFGAGDLPVGVQIIAKPFREDLLFRAAQVLEREASQRDRRPPLDAPPLDAPRLDALIA